MQKFIDVIYGMRDKKILVVGDLIADIYVSGCIDRISREAPVLVLTKSDEKIVAGGAANVAVNAAALDATVFSVGVTGRDKYAADLLKIFKNFAIQSEGVILDESRQTTSKTRIIAGGRQTVNQQIVRIDNMDKTPLTTETEKNVISKLEKILPLVDGVIISDYGIGTVTPLIRSFVLKYVRANSIPNIVDSRYDIGKFKGAGFVKQNDLELSSFVGYPIENMKKLIQAGRTLLNELDIEGALITRGAQGMSLFEHNNMLHNIPVSNAREVYDVSGAGDTCVAVFLLALVSAQSLNLVESSLLASKIANYAAGIAVKKLGTSVVTFDELIKVPEEKII